LLAGLAAGAVGHFDDVVPGHPGAKGLRGHLDALRAGRITSGVVKAVGLAIAGGLAAALLPSNHRSVPRYRSRVGRVSEVALGAGLIAGTANLINLLDLRPGRALKAGLLVAAPIVAARDPRRGASQRRGLPPVGPLAGQWMGARSALAGPVGAAVALLDDDLAERVMLGDAGANALGAVLGVALADRGGLVGRVLMLAVIVALTLASERVSFTEVIESTPVLRAWDQLGRARPKPP
jgi:UDP-N-acetylmuramyl pentapeptide phosphotransferase/UDP-N-acetylglucosamine-1-phosphate transferase